ncbi:hypothetical protein IBA8402_27360 [Pseudomonas syringae]
MLWLFAISYYVRPEKWAAESGLNDFQAAGLIFSPSPVQESGCWRTTKKAFLSLMISLTFAVQ